jgi:hypothetical protein
MYGTVARMRLKPGSEERLSQLSREEVQYVCRASFR